MSYHEGELAVQARAGVSTEAGKVGRIIGDTIPAAAAAFLSAQPFVITSTADAEGRLSASILAGNPGFTRAMAPDSIRVEPSSGHIDRVTGDLAVSSAIGILAIELATRRRMRANGNGVARNGLIVITTREVYSNCPQYIHPIELTAASGPPSSAVRSSELSPEQIDWISASDTFFVASAHPTAGADASHRGGPPGFVVVSDPGSLSFHDFPGNNMFNTLGNLEVNPRCGLLFVDFRKGSTLQLTGRARIRWTAPDVRDVEFSVEGIIETQGAVALRAV